MTLAVMRGVGAHGCACPAAEVPSKRGGDKRVRAAMLAAVAVLLVALAIPAGARAENAVTGATPNTINATFGVEHTDLVLEGTTDPGVTAVTVTVDDTDGATQAIALPASLGAAGGTWSLTIAGFMVSDLSDGPLTVSTDYTVGEEHVAAAPVTILKDIVAPEIPEAIPGGGLFNADLSV